MAIYSRHYCEQLPKFQSGVSVLSWAYNEEKLIEGFVRRLDALMDSCVEDYEIVVVDDGSTDATNDILKRLEQEIPQLRVLVNSVNRNVGYSSQRAIQSASKEILFWQTIDWSYDIDLLRCFLEMFADHDVVAGVRREPTQCSLPGVKPVLGLLRIFGIEHLNIRSDTVQKAFISVVNYVLIRLLFRVPLSDYQNVVFYRTSFVQSLTAEARSSFLNPELLLKAYWSGAAIAEVPIKFIPRTAGVATGTRLRAIMASVSDIFKFWVQWIVLGRRNKGVGRIDRLQPAQWDVCPPCNHDHA
ncbi:glycosyltransferase family 2 protein [Solidesulfovibrio sp.]